MNDNDFKRMVDNFADDLDKGIGAANRESLVREGPRGYVTNREEQPVSHRHTAESVRAECIKAVERKHGDLAWQPNGARDAKIEWLFGEIARLRNACPENLADALAAVGVVL